MEEVPEEEVYVEDIQEKLDEVLELSRKNNRLLRKIKRGETFRRILGWIYILLIIASFFLTFYFLKPQMKNLMSIYSGNLPTSASSTESNQNTLLEFQKLLNQ